MVFSNLTHLEDLTKRLGALRTQEQNEYEFFWDNALGLFVVATAPYFIKVNPRWKDVLGFETDELVAVPWLDLIHQDDRPKSTETALSIINNLPQAEAFRNRFAKKNGGYAILEWKASRFVRGYFCAIANHIGDEL